jgi:hypothetical protein
MAGWAEKAAMILLALLAGWWYLSEPQVRGLWAKQITPWFEEMTGQLPSQTYSDRDLAMDWAANADVYGVVPFDTIREWTSQGRTEHPLWASPKLRWLLAPLPATIGPSNTPISASASRSPLTTDEERGQRDWIYAHPQHGGSIMSFVFGDGGIPVRPMQRVVIVGDPTTAFVGTDVLFFWRFPDKTDMTSKDCSVRARFYAVNGQAVAFLPLGRYVEWWREPIVKEVRIDTSPRYPNARYRVVALPVAP